MVKRPIIEIDRAKCDGCGICTTSCAEGALALDQDNKAVLLKEIYCDGLGACLDVCPTGALKVIERESDGYNPQASYEHVEKTRGKKAAAQVHGIAKPEDSLKCGCPSFLTQEIKRDPVLETPLATESASSELTQWPIQLQLVSPASPYFEKSDLLIAADCTSFSFGKFHSQYLKGKKLIIFCPKLDDTTGYVEKLAEIIKNNTIYSLTVLVMTVTCCSGTYQIIKKAVELSGKSLEIKKIVINLDGSIA